MLERGQGAGTPARDTSQEALQPGRGASGDRPGQGRAACGGAPWGRVAGQLCGRAPGGAAVYTSG